MDSCEEVVVRDLFLLWSFGNPSKVVSGTYPIRQNASKPSNQTAEQIKRRVSLGHFGPHVPRRQQIRARREETGLKDAQQHAQGQHGSPGVHQAVADHDQAPRSHDEREEAARSEFARDRRHGWLEGDVEGEEDQNQKRL